ncbi:MAG: hypothetical protein U1E60_09545 [Reyranellaceae bacterium]
MFSAENIARHGHRAPNPAARKWIDAMAVKQERLHERRGGPSKSSIIFITDGGDVE